MGHELALCAREMAALESHIERLLGRSVAQVKVHEQSARAVNRFRTLVESQRKALEARLPSLGGSPLEPTTTTAVPSFRTPLAWRPGASSEAISRTLQGISMAFNYAAFAYARLHAIAHRFYDGPTEDSTAALAERHLRNYVLALQEINQLISDVVVWELEKADQECQCMCPACGLGICVCAPHGTTTVDQVWREMPPPLPQQGVQVRPPRANSAALHAGLRQGDIVVAVDGQAIQTVADLQAGVRKHQAGEEIRLRVQRRIGGEEGVIVTRP